FAGELGRRGRADRAGNGWSTHGVDPEEDGDGQHRRPEGLACPGFAAHRVAQARARPARAARNTRGDSESRRAGVRSGRGRQGREDRPAESVSTLILTELRTAVATRGVAFIATTQQPDGVDPRLRAPDLCDRELGLSLPDGAVRKQLLEVLLREVPSTELNLD